MILNANIPICDIISLISSSQEQSSLLCYNLQSSLIFGVLEHDSYIVELSGSSQTSCTLLVADNEKQLRIWELDGEMLREKTPESCKTTILDLTSHGDRWEGSVSDNNPFGYGILYNEKGLIVYEGFMYEGRYCCYGTTYYSDIEKISYSGQFCNGKRHGYGQSFTRYEEIDYQGQWCMGFTYGNSASSYFLCSKDIHYSTQTEYAYDMQISKLPFNYIPNIQSISIETKCFTNLPCLEIVNLPYLQALHIGRESFMIRKGRSIEGTQECIIRNCPQLGSIKIEDDAFCNCNTFTICELDQLDSLAIGMNCFWKCSVFELHGREFDQLVFTYQISPLSNKQILDGLAFLTVDMFHSAVPYLRGE